jgi:Putative Flp pilus-assembly TadE/G-like
MTTRTRLRDDRGAIIIHVAFALLALLAFSAFVVDMGVMWVSRRQAQNAADAGALAGAVALMKDGGTPAEAAKSALQWTNDNAILGASSSAANVRITFSGPVAGTCGPSCDVATIPPCLNKPGCVRADVFRNAPDRAYRGGATLGAPIPAFFGPLIGITQQRVRATATAEVASGNQIRCLLPFAAIDRWADNHDENPDPTYFANDPLTGTAGWSQNDMYQSAQGDVYIPPYNGNTNHTGWKVTNDFGRQMVLKDGAVGTYSAGWALTVDLPDSTGSQDYKWNIQNCNQQPVGIATQPEACSTVNEPIGCVSVKTGVAQGPTSQGIGDVAKGLVGQDPTAHWDSGQKTVLGGGGLSSPRVRPMVVLDINNYVAQGCSGTTCVGKVANIIGFFVEGMCKDVTLDPGIGCDDPTKDVVGRIVTVPGSYVSGSGGAEESASFVKVVRLVR